MSNHDKDLLRAVNKDMFNDETIQGLSRAINTRRTIGFLGSGLSRSYGHFDWDELVNECAREALKHLKSLEGDLPPNDEAKRRHLFTTLTSASGGNKSSEVKMATFAVARLAFEFNEKHRGKGPDASDAPASFEDYLATLVSSDYKFALKLLTGRLGWFVKALGNDSSLDSKFQKLYEDFAGNDENEILSFEHFYHTATISVWCKYLEDAGVEYEVLETIKGIGKELKDDSTECIIPPDRRSLVQLIIARISLYFLEQGKQGEDKAKAFAAEILNYVVKKCFVEKHSGTDSIEKHYYGAGTSRSVRPICDPIKRIIDDLGIWRLLTTNYDLEIETYVEKHHSNTDLTAFPSPWADNTPLRSSRNHLGERAETDVMSPDRIAPLINMASRSNENSIEVLHIHGRADRSETLVATEASYKDIYLRKRAYEQDLDHALTVLYSGNPILFIGSGLSERDLERPLREFESNPGQERRDLYALMPADKSPNENHAFCINVYDRLGVRVLLYGEKEIDDPTQTSMQIAPLVTSLCDRKNALKAVSSACKESRDALIKGDVFPEQLFDDLSAAVNELLDTLFEDGIFVKKTGEADRSDSKASESLFTALVAAVERVSAGIPSDYEKNTLIATLEMVIDYLGHLKSKVVSAVLDRGLRDIVDYRDQWWKDVQPSAEPRRTIGAQIKDCTDKYIYIYDRHAMVWTGSTNNDDDKRGKKFLKTISADAHLARTKAIMCYSEFGSGKGSFYNAIRKEFLGEEHPSALACKFHVAFFANVSHSIEFSSVMIALTNFLKRLYLTHKEEKIGGDLDIELKRFRDRSGYREFLLHIVEKLKGIAKPRLHHRGLLVFTGLDRLTIDGGRPATIEIKRVFETLAELVNVDIGLTIILITNRLENAEGFFPAPNSWRLKSEDWLRSISTSDTKKNTIIHGKKVRKLLATQCIIQGPIGESAPVKLAFKDNEKFEDTIKAFDELCDSIGQRYYLRVLLKRLIDGLQDSKKGNWSNDALVRWCEQLKQSIESTPSDGVYHRIFNKVLTAYQELGVDLSGNPESSRVAFQALQLMTILGFPVEISVLARVPAISKLLLGDKYPGDIRTKELEELGSQLCFLVDGGLIGVIQPRSRRAEPPGPGEEENLSPAPKGNVPSENVVAARAGFRFVLHPRLKQHLLSNISHKGYDAHLTNTFVFSLFASQPTDVPMLSNDTIHLVDETLSALVQGWRLQEVSLDHLTKSETILEHLSEKKYFFDAKTTKGAFARASSDMQRCFRSAYGILRQMRPFAVIARTDLSENLQQSRFEETGERMRDLIFGVESSRRARQALLEYIESQYPNDDPEQKRVQIEKTCLNTWGPTIEGEHPIYSHELAWLWNERGVLALAQGRLYDAIPYLRRAKKELAGSISSRGATDNHMGHEGIEGNGPATKRVELNLAVASIERGHLRRADKELVGIIEANKALMGENAPEHSFEVIPVAEGYRAITAHLSGNIPAATLLYNKSLDELSALRRHRAVSIFSRAYADLLMQDDNPDGTHTQLRRAEAAAQAMKQLDQTHFVMVCNARFVTRFGDHAERIKSRDELIRVLEYARAAKLLQLECETLSALSGIELEEQSFNDAGKCAAMALAIATRHGMRIQRINAKITLAEVFLKMGAQEEEAKTLLDRCEHRAQVCNYILALQRIQKIRMAQFN